MSKDSVTQVERSAYSNNSNFSCFCWVCKSHLLERARARPAPEALEELLEGEKLDNQRRRLGEYTEVASGESLVMQQSFP